MLTTHSPPGQQPLTAIFGSPEFNAPSTSGAENAWDRVRYLVFGGILTMLWLTPNPNATSFRDDPTAGREGSLVVQLVWFMLLLFGLFATMDRWRVIRHQVDITFLALFGWCALTVFFAIAPDVASRRFAFTLICVCVMSISVAGIKRIDALIWILLGMCIVETMAKYVFVFALPSLGRHLPTGDEPQLAGLWKGQYAHKNAAGPVCAIELMLLYATRRVISPLIVAPLAAAEVVFLFESGSKTPLFLLLLMVVFAKVVVRIHSGLVIIILVLGGLGLLNVITLASVFSDDARLIATKLIGDATFTGRIDVWRFLMHYSLQAPLMGAGFQSFWQVGDLSPAVTEGSNWVVKAVYGHQGFLDTVVMIGYVGLTLLLCFVVIRPAMDLARVKQRRGPILEMFVTFWLFGLFSNGTESTFLGRADAVWLFCLAGIVGIRRYALEGSYRAYYPGRESPAAYIRLRGRRETENAGLGP